jgi:hypothetical protein
MTRVEQTWPIDAFDAISIKAQQGKFVIKGIDGDQVKLEGDFAARYSKNLELWPEGRWLRIHTTWQYGESHFTLQLPKSKIWMINIFSGKAQFTAENIQSRLHLWAGKGDIQIENCRGALSISSGNADIRVQHFTGMKTPEIPPLEIESRNFKWDDPEFWADRGEEWAKLGEELGEKITRGIFGQNTDITAGINIQTGKGGLNMEDINTRSCVIRTARGDVVLKQGRIGILDMKIINGDIKCESCLPTGNWNLRANRGDVRLALPSDTTARLDLTTRHGDIQSKTPLVRVTRQGPESWHGNRMVGSIGTKIEGELPEVRVSTISGDIEIKTQPASSRDYEKPVNETIIITPPVSSRTDTYDTPLAVLTALSNGKISIEEAERRLRELKS